MPHRSAINTSERYRFRSICYAGLYNAYLCIQGMFLILTYGLLQPDIGINTRPGMRTVTCISDQTFHKGMGCTVIKLYFSGVWKTCYR